MTNPNPHPTPALCRFAAMADLAHTRASALGLSPGWCDVPNPTRLTPSRVWEDDAAASEARALWAAGLWSRRARYERRAAC